MNLSIPILICDEHDEIRLLLKDMLTKHGYFHLLEAQSSAEVIQMSDEDHFILIHKNMIDERVKKLLSQRKNFLIVAQSDDKEAVTLSAFFGVKHLISFPYSSHGLIERINKVLN